MFQLRPVSAAVAALHFEYTGTELKELFRVNVDPDVTVVVVGDPNNACYEWVIERAERVERYSDCGYGSSDLALRDGLIAYHGLPEGELVERVVKGGRRV